MPTSTMINVNLLINPFVYKKISAQLASNSPPKNREKMLKNLVGGWTDPFETYYTPEN